MRILNRRADGFHNLETVFYPLPLHDALEILPTIGLAQPLLHIYGNEIPGETASNLCMKAWALLKQDYPSLPPVEIHLLKQIPMGAGLGGGSADGAFMLQLLNTQFNLDITQELLLQYAERLGSDCPFFIISKACYAGGKGELLRSISVNLTGYQLILVTPPIHVNTAWAFSQLRPGSTAAEYENMQAVMEKPVASWRNFLINDFEAPVFAAFPQLEQIKEELYQRGALYAAMSGSGSSVFGIFEASVNLQDKLPPHARALRL